MASEVIDSVNIFNLRVRDRRRNSLYLSVQLVHTAVMKLPLDHSLSSERFLTALEILGQNKMNRRVAAIRKQKTIRLDWSRKDV